MIIEKKVKQRETIILEKKGEDKFKGLTKAKSFRGWLNGMINKFSKKDNKEWEFAFREILNAYNHFNPEQIVPVEIKGWKGKSSFEVIKKTDGLRIIKYQRPDSSSKPLKIETEVSREELCAVIDAINIFKGKNGNRKIKTREIAIDFCFRLGIGERDDGKNLFEGNFWDNFFSWRRMHNKLTLILGALEELNLIKYKAGITEVLDNNLSIQKVL